jgi:16S rRNA (adenine1518-N6/adenine1519-N6)-dimethyltransferase
MSKHIARKRFGQHFLSDRAIIDQIVAAINPKSDEAIVEIGPGLAALTTPLLAYLPQLTVIELDRDLAQRLRANTKLHVIEADALSVDFADIAQKMTEGRTEASTLTKVKIRVVGNLPYNISTPLLFHLLRYVDVIIDQHFMLQKEVVRRMAAKPATSDFGRLSVMLQWRYQVDDLFDVPPESFSPPPKVDSSVVRLIPRADYDIINVALLEDLVRVAFSQRRKLLRHTLGKWLQEKKYGGLFDVQRRAEEVPVHEYISLVTEVAAT